MTFTIDHENNITAHGSPEEAAAATATPFDSFSTQQELAELAKAWPLERLVAVWDSLPGGTPVKRYKPTNAASRIWARIQGLGEAATPKANRKAKAGARAAKGAPPRAKASMKASTAKKASKGRKVARTQEAIEPRDGSKTAQVVAMLQRKNGATLAEIMEKMGWQKHTVRGFMAGALKKAGYAVESFKSAKGERTSRINE